MLMQLFNKFKHHLAVRKKEDKIMPLTTATKTSTGSPRTFWNKIFNVMRTEIKTYIVLFGVLIASLMIQLDSCQGKTQEHLSIDSKHLLKIYSEVPTQISIQDSPTSHIVLKGSKLYMDQLEVEIKNGIMEIRKKDSNNWINKLKKLQALWGDESEEILEISLCPVTHAGLSLQKEMFIDASAQELKKEHQKKSAPSISMIQYDQIPFVFKVLFNQASRVLSQNN